MNSHPVVKVIRIQPLSDGTIGVECLLRCGCIGKGRVPAERVLEIIEDRYLVVGTYPCPNGCTSSGKKS